MGNNVSFTKAFKLPITTWYDECLNLLNSSSIVKLVESEVPLEQVQEMDELSLKRWSVEEEDPFYPFARVL